VAAAAKGVTNARAGSLQVCFKFLEDEGLQEPDEGEGDPDHIENQVYVLGVALFHTEGLRKPGDNLEASLIDDDSYYSEKINEEVDDVSVAHLLPEFLRSSWEAKSVNRQGSRNDSG